MGGRGRPGHPSHRRNLAELLVTQSTQHPVLVSNTLPLCVVVIVNMRNCNGAGTDVTPNVLIFIGPDFSFSFRYPSEKQDGRISEGWPGRPLPPTPTLPHTQHNTR